MARPGDLKRRELLQKLLGPGAVPEQVIVHEKTSARPQRPYLADNIVHRPDPVACPDERGDGTESAVVRAAARSFDRESRHRQHPGEKRPRPRRVVKLFFYQIIAGDGPAGHRRTRVPRIDLLRRSGAEILEEPRPGFLCLPDEHGVGVFQRLLRLHTDMYPAHSHINAAAAEFIGYVIGAGDGLRITCDADYIRPGREVHLLHHVDTDLDLRAGRSQRGEARQGDRGDKTDARPVNAAVAPVPRGLYQEYFHGRLKASIRQFKY